MGCDNLGRPGWVRVGVRIYPRAEGKDDLCHGGKGGATVKSDRNIAAGLRVTGKELKSSSHE